MTDLTPFAIYLIFTADDLKALFFIGGVIGGLVGSIACFFDAVEEEPSAVKFGKPTAIIAFVAMCLSIAVPGTKTLVAMYGIPALIEGTKSAAKSEVGQKAYSAVNKLLDDYLSEKAKP